MTCRAGLTCQVEEAWKRAGVTCRAEEARAWLRTWGGTQPRAAGTPIPSSWQARRRLGAGLSTHSPIHSYTRGPRRHGPNARPHTAHSLAVRAHQRVGQLRHERVQAYSGGVSWGSIMLVVQVQLVGQSAGTSQLVALPSAKLGLTGRLRRHCRLWRQCCCMMG